MKLTRSFIAIFLNLSLISFSFLSLAIQSASAQDTRVALQRGYRTGYSDGYMSGYRDAIENSEKSYERHNEYVKADRAYNKDYGVLEDYRDGYQQGFETGYNTGFEKRSFDATIPGDLKKRGVITVKTTVENTTTIPVIPVKTTPTQQTVATNTNDTTTTENPVVNNQVSENSTTSSQNTDTVKQVPLITANTEKVNYDSINENSILIPTNTELIVELLDDINTDRSREGDKFTARVISPYEISGSIIEGRVGKIQRPGRIKRRAELSLSFDRFILPDNRWSNFNAILSEVLPSKGDNVKRVDVEGTVAGKGSIKEDSIKVGATTGTGLAIGAIAGGPVGAAVGAGVGAAFGVGAVIVERGKHIRLSKNQQLRIKTAYETQIR